MEDKVRIKNLKSLFDFFEKFGRVEKKQGKWREYNLSRMLLMHTISVLMYVSLVTILFFINPTFSDNLEKNILALAGTCAHAVNAIRRRMKTALTLQVIVFA